jgi:hypothetical protein
MEKQIISAAVSNKPKPFVGQSFDSTLFHCAAPLKYNPTSVLIPTQIKGGIKIILTHTDNPHTKMQESSVIRGEL